MTVADLINGSLFDLGLLQEGETPNADMQSFAFARLNDWVDDLKTQGLSVYVVLRTLWTLNTSASYTIGTGGIINVDRPVNPQAIQNIGFINNGVTPAYELMCGPPMTEDVWENIVFKSYQATYPTNFYYQTTYDSSSQFGLIYPWPIPTASNLQGVIYTNSPVNEFAAVTDTIYLPPGYRRFFRTNAAMELASAFDQEPRPTLVKAAMESMGNVKRSNYRLADMSCGAVAGLFGNASVKSNIYTGTD